MEQEVRILRYHMSSGHILQEVVADSVLKEQDDATLVKHMANVLDMEPFLAVRDVVTDSAVLMRTSAVEMVQVGHAALHTSPEEEEAIVRAKLHLVDPREASDDD